MAAESDINKAKSIEITAAWETQLKELPYLSQRSGKTIHLLKASSKAIKSGKKRKKVPLLGNIGHYKDSKKLATQA